MSAEITSKTKDSLVDKILEQGQKLRNAMVQSILQNDPLHSVIQYSNNKYDTSVISQVPLTGCSSNKKLLEAFLNGDYLTKDEEKIAFSIVRSMPGLEVFKATEEKLFTKCPCPTCSVYHINDLKCDLKRNEKLFKPIEPMNSIDTLNVLKQANSLKIILQSIHLNSLGEQKIAQSLNKQSSHLNETFFVKYCIPKEFLNDIVKSKSKVDSGLKHNEVRVCSRRISNVIYLKQTFVHSVCNLHHYNLEDHDLTFVIRYKSSFQKKSEQLGIAKFNFSVFNDTKNASSGKTLSIYVNEASSISVGTIKVALQLGADKLYFGQKFIGAVLPRENLTVTISSSDEGTRGDLPSNKQKYDVEPLKNFIDNRETMQKLPRKQISSDNQQERTNIQFQEKKRQQFTAVAQTSKIVNNLAVAEVVALKTEAELLFGFLYISEAQFLNNTLNTFIKCQPYCENVTSISRIVYGSSTALYNFLQIVPLLYEEDLLLKLRDNFMVIEFWGKKKSTEEILGLTRLPLHQFYLGYRNGVILKHLKRNNLPIIGTDWWEPIYSIDSNELIGQVQVLTALGTENQIKKLQEERGFKNDSVKAKFNITPEIKNPDTSTAPSSYFTDRAKVNKESKKLISVRKLSHVNHPLINISKASEKRKVVKLDVGVQSDMDLRVNSNAGESNPPQMLDTIASFLKLLEKTQRPPCVENSTNTEFELSSGTSTGIPNNEQPQLRKTSDLLDSLQKALSLDTIPAPITPQMPPHFKAEILIYAANNLPSRRKIKSKSKRTKGKPPKHEENILPSTYVTFETLPGCPLKVTNVFPKCTSPKWNFTCQVFLPMDLVQNGQKRLIFKVWQKCTNAVLQPNMQTDLVLGFAALDLSVLSSVGLPNIQGWFNIIDFSGKCNGQINIHINPLEKLAQTSSQINNEAKTSLISGSPVLWQIDESDYNELLGRALKRKFSELDEITQRLRLRLSEVVSEDSDDSSDDITEEFEHDINNLCIEEDFDLIDFEEEARKFNVNYSHHKAEKKSQARNANLSFGEPQPGSSKDCHEKNNCKNTGNLSEESSAKDNQLGKDSSGLLMENKGTENKSESISSKCVYSSRSLADGKHRINSLLEKLTLLTSEATQPFSTRYVSDSSATTNEVDDIKDIFKDLEQHSRPNITAVKSFDPVLFQQLYGGCASDTSPQNTNKTVTNDEPNEGDNSKGNNHGLNVGSSSISSMSNGSSKVCVNNDRDETGVLSGFSDRRPNPIGQGTCSGKK